MAGDKKTTLETLQLKYNKALAAHEACLRRLADARVRGSTPSHALIAAEAIAHSALNAARAQLLAAMLDPAFD